MFPKALIATDLSPSSDHLVECAAQLQAVGVRSAHLLHVAESRFSVGLDAALADSDQGALDRQAEELRGQGYAVESSLRRGVAWYEIVTAAREMAADLVVVASHGYGAVAESILGGTAARVVEQAPAPVLLLRMGLLDEQGGRYCRLRFAGLLDHVLFPTDFSPVAQQAFQAVLKLAPRSGRITLLHVNQEAAWEHLTPDIPASFEDEDRSRLDDRIEALRNAGCPHVSHEIVRGDRRKMILENAASDAVTLVVLGTRGWSPLKELPLGSTAHTLVRRAPTPVLLVGPGQAATD